MRFLGDDERIRRMSIIDESGERYVRMAHLACVGSHADQRRGGAAHRASQARRAQGFLRALAEEVQQQDQRRHAAALDGAVQSAPVEPHHRAHRRRLDQGPVASSRRLEPLAEDAGVPRTLARDQAGEQAQLRRAGRGAHRDTSSIPSSMFDVLVKRIHEYKRQHLKVLHIVSMYLAHQVESRARRSSRAPSFSAARPRPDTTSRSS